MPERSSKIMYPANRRPIGVSVPSRLPTRAALAVVALAVIALLPTVALLGRLGLLTDPMVWASFVLVLGFLAVGLVTTVRRVGNPIGWLLLWQGVVAGLSLLGAAYGMYDLQVAAESLPGGSLLLWTSTWIWLAALAVSPVIHVLFPGRLLSRRWAGSSGWPGVDGAGHRGHRGRGLAAAGADAAGGTVLGPGVGSAAAPCPRRTGHVRGGRGRLLDRHGDPSAPSQGRRARADQVVPLRRQLVILGITLEIVLGVPITIASWLGGMVVPFAIAVALFKYRLYDIDRLINRTLVYGLLTAHLGSIYAAAVLVLGQVFGGVANNPPSWAVAVATLAVASLFQPARRRIQRTVDRRFNRRRYDAAKTIEAYSARLRDQIDLDTLSTELLAIVHQTTEPTRASLWLHSSAPGSSGRPNREARPATWAY